MLRIGSVRKAAFHDSRLRIFWIFFHIFSPDGAASPFQTEASHHTGKWTHLYLIEIEDDDEDDDKDDEDADDDNGDDDDGDDDDDDDDG